MPTGDPLFDILYAQADGMNPVVTGGTITFSYPIVMQVQRDGDLPVRNPDSSGGSFSDPSILTATPIQRSASEYQNGKARLSVRALQGQYREPTDFTVAYNPTNIVVTWLGATNIPGTAIVALEAPLIDTSGQPTDTFAQPLPDPLTGL